MHPSPHEHRRRLRPGAVILGALLGGLLLPSGQAQAEPADIEPLACSSVPSTHDPEVIRVVQRVGVGRQVSSKVMLAGFEAGWVESHLNNLTCGDADSLGVFQQRPSWGSVTERTNVVYAANAFFSRAEALEPLYPSDTAGELAQRVQVSAYPDRYDAAQATALDLIDEATQLYVSQQHVIAQTASGGIYHTLRSGTAWTTARSVEGQSGPIGSPIVSVASAQVNGELHVLAVAGGEIYHAIRQVTHGWTDWGNVENPAGEKGYFTSVAAAEVNGELHVVATDGTTVYHTIRHRSGSWNAFGNVEGQAGSIADPTQVAAAGIGSNLHVLVVSSDGVLRHAIRTPSDWTSWGNVEVPAGNVGEVQDVAATGVLGALHVVVSNSQGGLFHTIRSSSGWTSFGNVEGQAGDIGTVQFVGVTGRDNGDLHVLAVNSSGTPYHTIRSSSGWTNFGNVDNQVDYPEAITEIAAG
jgi:hypothetical protein